MERLTIKNSDGSYSQPTDTTFYEIFNKLGELEDVLEKWNIEDLDKFLDEQISDLQHRLEVAERATKLACDELRHLNYIIFDNADIEFEQQFKKQAEKEIKGE